MYSILDYELANFDKLFDLVYLCSVPYIIIILCFDEDCFSFGKNVDLRCLCIYNYRIG